MRAVDNAVLILPDQYVGSKGHSTTKEGLNKDILFGLHRVRSWPKVSELENSHMC